MMRQKKMILVLLAGMMVVSMSACGKESSGWGSAFDNSVLLPVPEESERNEVTESDEATNPNEETKPDEAMNPNETLDPNEMTKPVETAPPETESIGTSVSSDAIRPEFKEALDSYETFIDEYCEFMKKYNESPNDLTLLLEYGEFTAQYADTMQKIEALDDGELSDAELKYYVEVTNRINEKLLTVTATL